MNMLRICDIYFMLSGQYGQRMAAPSVNPQAAGPVSAAAVCVGIAPAAASTGITPQTVTAAVNTPGFYQNRGQFWNMLHYLFSDHRGAPVWQVLPPQTMRNVMIQLHHLTEAEHSPSVFEQSRDLLASVYFATLHKVKGLKSQTRFLYDESAEFLKAIYDVYRLLHHLRHPNLPNFGRGRSPVS